MIVFENVTKLYDGKVVGMQDVSFHIPKGEFVFLVGPSGSGKSTLIRLVLRELRPDEGRVIVSGRNLSTLRRSKVPHLRRNIGCVFQDFKLLPNKSVYDNVAYALEVVGEPRKLIRRKVPEILKLVGLFEKMNNLPSEISGGEEQRVSIARAFVNHPPLLLADEPTGNLDPETSIGIMQLLERINRTGTTVVVATHDRDMVNRMRKRVFALEGGRLMRDERRGGYEETGEIPVVVPVGATGSFPAPGPAATGAIPVVAPAPGRPGIPPVAPPAAPGQTGAQPAVGYPAGQTGAQPAVAYPPQPGPQPATPGQPGQYQSAPPARPAAPGQSGVQPPVVYAPQPGQTGAQPAVAYPPQPGQAAPPPGQAAPPPGQTAPQPAVGYPPPPVVPDPAGARPAAETPAPDGDGDPQRVAPADEQVLPDAGGRR
jgi:cell division transport system ATP-binding protein